LEALVNKSSVTLKAQKRNRYLGPALLAFMGCLFVYFGKEKSEIFNMASVMGAGFILFSIAQFIVIRRWLNETDEKENNNGQS